ncbi:MAG TPA: type II toxin-antitoxin system prevent-host-death family antitoxin [Verrucomicrobiae bacterium]|jgi:prevent-host-death family protein
MKSKHTCSLTDFKRNAKARLKQLKMTGRPLILTVRGKPTVTVQSASAFFKMLDVAKFGVTTNRSCTKLDKIPAKYKIRAPKP